MINKNIYNRHNPDLYIYDSSTDQQIEVIDLSKYKYVELHSYFSQKFGKIGEELAVDEAVKTDKIENIVENDKNDGTKSMKQQELERAKMNAEIFEGIGGNIMINTSSMNSKRAFYVGIFIIAVLFTIYLIAFNPSLLKRTFHLCGCDSYFGAKATV